eukprot:scaffold26866_cov122-Isochrysis_galbana.AAC.2
MNAPSEGGAVAPSLAGARGQMISVRRSGPVSTFNTGCQNVANEAGTKMLMACPEDEELGQCSNMFSK